MTFKQKQLLQNTTPERSKKLHRGFTFIEVMVVSAVILVFGEILPKMAAIRQSKKFASRVYSPLRAIMSVLYPVAQGFYSTTIWARGPKERF